MPRVVALVVLSVVGMAAGSEHTIDTIEIFTKPAGPMSFLEADGATVAGYSIEFWKVHMAPKLGITNVQVTMLTDNNEIMSTSGLLSNKCNTTEYPNTLCVGAAAISITESREVNFDYFTSYYTNNVRVLTTVQADPSELLSALLGAVGWLILGIFVFSLLFCLIMTPIIWAFEMLTITASDELSIFMPSDKAVDKYGGNSAWARGRYIVVSSLKNALFWTVYTFQGTQLAPPKSKGANVLMMGIHTSSSFVGILATAVCATIFTMDMRQASAIGGVADLGPTHKVCYNTASTFNTNLVMTKASEQSFKTVPCDGLSTTLYSYYDGRCDAVIYDEVILEGDLKFRRQDLDNGRQRNDLGKKSRVQKSGVVGDSLLWDPYGFLVNSGYPQYEIVNRAVVSVATNAEVREALWTAHLSTIKADGGGLDFLLLLEWTAPAAVFISFSLIVFFGSVVYFKTVCKRACGDTRSSRTTKAGFSKSMRSAMSAKSLERGMADIALQSSNNLTHEMAFDLQDLQTNMQALLLKVDQMAGQQMDDVHTFKEVRIVLSVARLLNES